MKPRRLLLFFCLMMTSGLGFGQGLSKIDVDLGIKLGANLNQINSKYWENGFKANLLGGAYLGVNGGRLGVQIEGLFTQSTYTTSDSFHTLYQSFYNDIADSAKQGNLRVNYLSIPLLLNVKIFNRVTLQLGPQFSGVVSVNDRDELLKDAKGLFARNDWSGVVGLWVNLPLHLNVGARYVIGFSNINEAENSSATVKAADDAWKQRTLQLHVGFNFL